MQNNLKNNLTVHNKFELTLKDAKTGRVKQVAYAENIVVDQFYGFLAHDNGNKSSMFQYLAIGTGQGTPATTDTALFKHMGRIKYTSYSRNLAYPTSTMAIDFEFPATSSYVGDITEVGLER